jgi:hypothetical protein
MRATSIIVALGALLCLLAMAPATHHKPATATAQSLTPEQQAALDAWLADPANAAQLNADQDSNGSDSPMGRRPQLTDDRKAAIIAQAKGISIEDALLEVQQMNANVQALFEASVENAKRK